MTTTTRLGSVFSPVLTPFNADLPPSVERFTRHCNRLLKQHVALSIFGTNSEATFLTLAEKHRLLDALLEAGLPAARMMPTSRVDSSVTLLRTPLAMVNGPALLLPETFELIPQVSPCPSRNC